MNTKQYLNYNFLDIDNNCSIAGYSSQHKQCQANNLLNKDKKCIWLSEEGLPQGIVINTMSLKNKHNSCICFGIYCWHAYKTNPKNIELFISKSSHTTKKVNIGKKLSKLNRNNLHDDDDDSEDYNLEEDEEEFNDENEDFESLGIYETALKPGTQLFQLQREIDLNVTRYIKLVIHKTHGADKTYINNIFLYIDFPDFFQQDSISANSVMLNNNNTHCDVNKRDYLVTNPQQLQNNLFNDNDNHDIQRNNYHNYQNYNNQSNNIVVDNESINIRNDFDNLGNNTSDPYYNKINNIDFTSHINDMNENNNDNYDNSGDYVNHNHNYNGDYSNVNDNSHIPNSQGIQINDLNNNNNNNNNINSKINSKYNTRNSAGYDNNVQSKNSYNNYSANITNTSNAYNKISKKNNYTYTHTHVNNKPQKKAFNALYLSDSEEEDSPVNITETIANDNRKKHSFYNKLYSQYKQNNKREISKDSSIDNTISKTNKSFINENSNKITSLSGVSEIKATKKHFNKSNEKAVLERMKKSILQSKNKNNSNNNNNHDSLNNKEAHVKTNVNVIKNISYSKNNKNNKDESEEEANKNSLSYYRNDPHLKAIDKNKIANNFVNNTKSNSNSRNKNHLKNSISNKNSLIQEDNIHTHNSYNQNINVSNINNKSSETLSHINPKQSISVLSSKKENPYSTINTKSTIKINTNDKEDEPLKELYHHLQQMENDFKQMEISKKENKTITKSSNYNVDYNNNSSLIDKELNKTCIGEVKHKKIDNLDIDSKSNKSFSHAFANKNNPNKTNMMIKSRLSWANPELISEFFSNKEDNKNTILKMSNNNRNEESEGKRVSEDKSNFNNDVKESVLNNENPLFNGFIKDSGKCDNCRSLVSVINLLKEEIRNITQSNSSILDRLEKLESSGNIGKLNNDDHVKTLIKDIIKDNCKDIINKEMEIIRSYVSEVFSNNSINKNYVKNNYNEVLNNKEIDLTNPVENNAILDNNNLELIKNEIRSLMNNEIHNTFKTITPGNLPINNKDNSNNNKDNKEISEIRELGFDIKYGKNHDYSNKNIINDRDRSKTINLNYNKDNIDDDNRNNRFVNNEGMRSLTPYNIPTSDFVHTHTSYITNTNNNRNNNNKNASTNNNYSNSKYSNYTQSKSKGKISNYRQEFERIKKLDEFKETKREILDTATSNFSSDKKPDSSGNNQYNKQRNDYDYYQLREETLNNEERLKNNLADIKNNLKNHEYYENNYNEENSSFLLQSQSLLNSMSIDEINYINNNKNANMNTNKNANMNFKDKLYNKKRDNINNNNISYNKNRYINHIKSNKQGDILYTNGEENYLITNKENNDNNDEEFNNDEYYNNGNYNEQNNSSEYNNDNNNYEQNSQQLNSLLNDNNNYEISSRRNNSNNIDKQEKRIHALKNEIGIYSKGKKTDYPKNKNITSVNSSNNSNTFKMMDSLFKKLNEKDQKLKEFRKNALNNNENYVV